MTSSPATGGGQQPPAARPAPPAFLLTAHSFPGREHIYGSLNGNGNQDSFGRRQVPHGLILVTTDGCGSAADSATGSKAAVRIILNAAEQLLSLEPIPKPEEFAQALQEELLSRITDCARPLARDVEALNQVLFSSYLFTCLVGIISPEWTAVFGCGDGIYAINGSVKELQPREDNHPEYLAYLACQPVPSGFEDIGLKVQETIDTAKLRSLFLGSDGLEPLLKSANRDPRLFALSTLWSDSKFRDQSEVEGLFAPMQMDEHQLSTREGTRGSVIVKQKTLRAPFDDDTTFVCAHRNTAVSLPTTWAEYRNRYAPPPAPKVLYTPPASVSGENSKEQGEDIDPSEKIEATPAGAISTAGAEDTAQTTATVPAAADPEKEKPEADTASAEWSSWIPQWLRDLLKQLFGPWDSNDNSGKGGS